MQRKNAKACFGLAVMFLILCISGGCTSYSEPPKAEASLFAMNTYMTFTAYGENAETALDGAKARIQELESLWSVTDVTSEIYRANHSNGKSVEVSDETANLISFALDMAEETGGTLDPTIYPVLTAWGFATDTRQVPAQEQVAELLSLVDYTRISLEGTILTVPAGMELDLGAVGKGYTADLVTALLKEQGVESSLFSLGGNIQAIGSRPDGSDWRIGIRDPKGDGNLGVLEISDAAVVTSGGYENCFEDEYGNIYWHILNPSTGYPVRSGLQAVTIIGTAGRLCDALSTALFVMGVEQAEAYWRENGGFEMLLVTDQNEIFLTEGIADRFSLNDGRTETIRIMRDASRRADRSTNEKKG
ncbi:MAG TPA: FAD:protein FMN transferase [Candidatus Eisenbergiella merdavium]|uniref:FAD:protein FMN transferase n=1 Tax=Candidatus Eisenbergiella merdavium TaxID=2838551 RepID=A0A9D2NED9_9FIRM|nr:FAD:protein FMN transferase [Candidatus Eisenbergiella merdavium]